MTTQSTLQPALRSPYALLAEWRQRADLFKGYGATEIAATLIRVASELESALEADDNALLTLPMAAAASGYSADHLGRLIRQGTLPNAGRRNAPRIRACELPQKVPLRCRTAALAEGRPRSDVSSVRGRMARAVVHSDWSKR